MPPAALLRGPLPVRVGFDITCLKGPMGGYERYARSLLAALAELPGAHQLVVFTERRYGTCVVPPSPRVERRAVATLPRFILKVLLQDQTYWPVLLRRARLDVVHTPIFAGMVCAPRPYVLTVHDLIPLRLPETLTRSAAWYWRTILPRAVARAEVIITVSEFSRREICTHFGLPPERVVSIPLGVDARFQKVRERERLSAVRCRYRLPEDFLLFVGIASARKNIERLVRALAALPRAQRDATRLVLAGPASWDHAGLERVLDRSGIADRVQLLGIVADDDLPALYSLARGAVNLSVYEGFGLPALEALACGAPLLCANTSAFPEVVADCALMVDPTDEAAVTAALATLLAGGSEVAGRATRGIARAAEFTWRRTAEATLAVYERVAGRPTGSIGSASHRPSKNPLVQAT